jgi:polyhydroxybutyrate depolymerase
MCRKLSIFASAVLMVGLTTGPAFPAQAGDHCRERTGQSGYFNKIIDPVDSSWPRNYILYVPPGYRSNKATSLVFNFHGWGQNAAEYFAYTRMDALADKYKFILVTPAGLANSWNAGTCCGPAAALGIDDVGFTSDMIDQISSEYCIDQDRIYATGLSNGGSMSWRLACDLGDRIAGIAPVAGGMMLPPWPHPEYCAPSRPVSVIAFHGTDDVYGTYDDPSPWGGLGGLPSAEFWAAGICTDTTEVVYAEGEVTCFAYTECLEHGRVEFCTVEGGGHNWPGAIDPCESDPSNCWWAGYTTQDIDASRTIAKFFKKHRKRGDNTD